MSTLLIDGTNLFMTHWSANTALDINGNPIGATTGFVKFLSRFCQAYQPTKCIIFFDGKNGSVKRRSIFKEYKSGRKPRTIIARSIGFETIDAAEKNRDYQFKALMEILDTIPVNVVTCNDFETDDGIAYFIKNKERYGCEINENIVIVSCDKDFFQLLNDNILVYNSVSKKFITKDNIVEQYGISATNWLFYRSITGDKSDNIDGVRGIGPAKLKKVFDITSEEQYSINSIKNLNSENTILQNLKENIEKIERNERIMNLSEPLISVAASERLHYQLSTFEPRLDKKTFIMKASIINSIDISTIINFNSLLTRKNNDRQTEI